MSNIKAKSPSDRTEEIKRMAREIANADYENRPTVRELRNKAKFKQEEAERASKEAEKQLSHGSSAARLSRQSSQAWAFASSCS